MIALLLLLVVAAAAGGEGSTMRQPMTTTVPLRARLHRRQPLFGGRAANGCMPRGFRVPPSAPSRYVNYHTLDAGVCGDHGGGGRKP
jgi:hypothetical protein